MKEMKLNLKTWWYFLGKSNQFVVKLAVSVLLVGLAFRLISSRSNQFPDITKTPFVETSNSPGSVSLPGIIEQIHHEGSCNFTVGNWIRNPEGPLYTNESCQFIESHQNCMKNGRPDTDYLYWRWKPKDCELPQFDAKKFLEIMRNKAWALIGDSISRNHVQSLLCILSKVEVPLHVYHDADYKNRRWLFSSYNFTLSLMWSPFLAKAKIFEDYNGVSSSEIELHVDKLDSHWTSVYQNLDYIIFSSGKWFVKSAVYFENDKIMGCHYCPRRNLTELGIQFAYRKVISNVFDFVIKSNHKGMIFYRNPTPDHFEDGEWFSGGTCKRTKPAEEGEFQYNVLNRLLREVELEEFAKAEIRAAEAGVKLKLLDVTPLSLLRPDGHPGPYRHFHPFAKDNKEKIINDCLHWCLPGPIDSWNDLLMEMIVKG
ncbi:protein trichome birefringence-like 23 [Apium graveolens]|uniref:protein trichome birefringence-like 23 n=1 Tax=Apium graveolens TaxID=4045 RepID=UPI003D7A362B